ncbi:MAG: entericidin A/B family lipoprotein, partial [Pseudomonadota bacterium]
MHFAKSALAGLIALPLLAACNTIEGVGQDVQAVGSGVTSAAQFM